MIGTVGSTEACARLMAGLAIATLLASCSHPGHARSGVSLAFLLREIGGSQDGALSRIQHLVPDDGRLALSDQMRRPASLATSDGYTIERISINMDLQDEVADYAFHVAAGKCMPLEAVPGFSQAQRRAAPTSPPGALVKGSYQDWVLELPEAWVSIIPRAEDLSCIARVGVDRRAVARPASDQGNLPDD